MYSRLVKVIFISFMNLKSVLLTIVQYIGSYVNHNFLNISENCRTASRHGRRKSASLTFFEKKPIDSLRESRVVPLCGTTTSIVLFSGRLVLGRGLR